MKRLIILFLLLASFAVAAPLKMHLEEQRESSGRALPPLRPGEFVGTLMLGSFRALAVDLLWMRVEKLRLEGKFFQEVALLEVLAELQPHLPEVWTYHSYVQAYNISQSFRDKEKQWKWIREGILFLEKGLDKNPQNPEIEKMLAFIHWNRIYQTPLGFKKSSPFSQTYFKKKFLSDSRLNPPGRDPYYFAFHWARKAAHHFEKHDPVTDFMMVDSGTKIYQLAKSQEKRKRAVEILDLILDEEERIVKANPRLYRSLRSRFFLSHLERARYYLQEGKKEKALSHVDSVLKRAPAHFEGRKLKEEITSR